MFKKAKENKKGFTLAELLIVVAIIAVLVAISIPIFTSQLEKSREAVDLANMRTAYAECASAVLTGESTTSDASKGPQAGTDGSYSITVKLTQSSDGWTGDNKNASIGDFAVSGLAKTTGNVSVKVDTTGKCTISSAQ